MWLHGDPHPANVVVADGTLAGVLDFGELCAGDPATDLAAAWLLLPPGAAPRFFGAYARADEAVIRPARGWAVLRALSLIDIGRAGELGLSGGKATWGPAGRARSTVCRRTAPPHRADSPLTPDPSGFTADLALAPSCSSGGFARYRLSHLRRRSSQCTIARVLTRSSRLWASRASPGP